MAVAVCFSREELMNYVAGRLSDDSSGKHSQSP